jgi:hypothetical protein
MVWGLITLAYELQRVEVFDVPAWATQERYDIVAKFEGGSHAPLVHDGSTVHTRLCEPVLGVAISSVDRSEHGTSLAPRMPWASTSLATSCAMRTPFHAEPPLPKY